MPKVAIIHPYHVCGKVWSMAMSEYLHSINFAIEVEIGMELSIMRLFGDSNPAEEMRLNLDF